MFMFNLSPRILNIDQILPGVASDEAADPAVSLDIQPVKAALSSEAN